MKLDKLEALQVFDSRSEPTLKVSAYAQGFKASAIVPKGASTGEKEAFELVDQKEVFHGLGVLRNIRLIQDKIFEHVKDNDIFNQREFDYKMLQLDQSEYKTSIGGNTFLGVSLAVARLAAQVLDVPLYRYIGGINAYTLPMPMFNVLNGGKHANNGLSVQEIMIVPVGATSFNQSYEYGVRVYNELKTILKQQHLSTSLGDEGGFVVPLNKLTDAFDLLKKATQKAKLKFGKDIYISLDVAANSFYDVDKNKYKLDGEYYDAKGLIALYVELCKKYPILSIEDGLTEDDAHWKDLYLALKEHCLIVGDDLIATNKKLLEVASQKELANAMIVKVNQIGTLSETLETVNLALKRQVYTIVSHRSGDSEDDFISDLAVGINSLFIKSGAPARSERTSKYNRLLEIENELKSSSEFAGSYIRKYLVKNK